MPSTNHYNQLMKKIVNRTVSVAVIGLGNVGLPLLIEIAKSGVDACGFDIDHKKVDIINAGNSYIEDILPSDIQLLFTQNRLSVTTDFSKLKEVDAIIICLPTPLTNNFVPDMSVIESAVRNFLPCLTVAQLICLESSGYPGATAEIIKPLLLSINKKIGEEIFLATSPERVDPRNAQFNIHNTPKLVGADDKNSLALAKSLYELFIDHVVPVSSSQMAETVKLFENTFRAVNIAFVNEMAVLCNLMGLSVWEMLDAAFTKPFGIMPFYPGPGIGGHCINVNPYYLQWKAKEYGFDSHLITAATTINESMPTYVVQNKIAPLLNRIKKPINGSRILLVGIAYKPNLSEYDYSPAIKILQLLEKEGAIVSYFDPLIPNIVVDDRTKKSESLSADLLSKADLVVITVKHTKVDYALIAQHSPYVLDLVYATRGLDAGHIVLL